MELELFQEALVCLRKVVLALHHLYLFLALVLLFLYQPWVWVE